jgi:hypothetical protein
MAGATFDRVEDTVEDVYSYVFERDGEQVRLVWTESNSNVDAVPEPDQTLAGAIETDDSLVVRDVMGRRQTYEPHDGQVLLTVSQDPVFVDGAAEGLTTEGPMVAVDAPDVAAGERVPITIETTGLSNAAVEIEGTRHDLDGEESMIRASPRTDTGPHTIHADLLVDERRVGRLAATFEVKSPLTASVRPQIRDFAAGAGSLSVALQSNARNETFTVTGVDWGVGGASGSLEREWDVEASQTTTIDVPLEGFTFEPFASYERRLTIRFAEREAIAFSGEVVFAAVFQQELSVDGDVGELSATPAIDLIEHGVEQGPPEAFQSPDDIGGSVWLTYDQDTLYLGAAIDDDTHVQEQSPAGMWRSDSIQLGVAEPGADSYRELSIGLREQGPTVQAVTQPTKADNRTLESTDAVIERTDGTTTYEVAIPWAELPVSAGADRVALSLIANDDDGDGREGWLSWGGNIGNEKDPATFAIAQLQ